MRVDLVGNPARIAVAVPNLDQGRFLEAALDSIAGGTLPVSCAVLDAGSHDESVAILTRRAGELAFWRSHKDEGQAAAVNEGIARLCAETPAIEAVAWLNADDFYLAGGLDALWQALVEHPGWVGVSGAAALADEVGTLRQELPTARFDRSRFARVCTICQPATLVRREAWEQIGGLDATLDMCFDYDLWWRLSHLGPIGHIETRVAASRDHADTKTRRRRVQYFEEAKAIVRRETGDVPWHWFISEALERQVGFEVGRRPGFPGRIRAAFEAGAAYLRDRPHGAAT